MSMINNRRFFHMKKILFCIQWYPPYDSANTYCDEQIIKELVKDKDCEIHCLTYKRPQDKLYEVINSVHVHRFKRGLFWSWYIDQIHNNKKYSKIAVKINRILLRLKQLIYIPIYPIYEPIQCLRFAYNARRLNNKEHFDIVISEFHGMDSLLAGYYLRSIDKSIKYIPIYWDSMTGGYLPKYLPESFSRKRRLCLERKISSISDKIFAIKYSRIIYDSLGINFEDREKYTFLDIPRIDFSKSSNPIPLDEDLRPVIEHSSVNIIFAGSLGKRTVSYILSLLNDADKKINLIMVCGKQYHYDLSEYSKSYQSLTLKILDYMPYHKLSQLLYASDIFLNLGNDNPYLVPSKVYDYISYAKPIISICNIDDDTSKQVLSNYPNSLIIDERDCREYNVKKIKQFFYHYDKIIDISKLKELYSDATGKAYSDIIRFV